MEGDNLDIQIKWAAGDLDRAKAFAKELTALNPEVLLGITTPATVALQRETRTIPVLFAAVSDPIGSGFVKSFAHPDENITGFTFIEASLASKWPDLMRTVAPQVSSVALLFNPATAPFARYYLEKFYPAAETLHIEGIEAVVTSTADIESTMAKFGDAHAVKGHWARAVQQCKDSVTGGREHNRSKERYQAGAKFVPLRALRDQNAARRGGRNSSGAAGINIAL